MSIWKDRTALVTGASAGIGAEFARQLAAAGAHLILSARRVERLEALATELRAAHGVDVAVISGDLAADGGASTLAAAIAEAGLTVDVLVNNAGLGAMGAFLDNDWGQEQKVIRVNIEALVGLTHALTPGMIERGFGRVILLGSVLAYTPAPLFASYSATKAYVRSFGEALGHELKNSGVRVTVVHPGGTRSEFSETANMVVDRSADKMMMDVGPVVRIGLNKAAKGGLSVVTGAMNKFMVALISMMPRFMKLGLMAKVYKGLLPKA